MRTALKVLFVLSMTVLAGFLSGCASDIGSRTPDVACDQFSIIYWSKKDTGGTQRQVVVHNRVYSAICPAQAKRKPGN